MADWNKTEGIESWRGERQLMRAEYVIAVGTSDQKILGSNPKRVALLITTPSSNYVPGTALLARGNAVPTATTGNKVTLALPGGVKGQLVGATAVVDAGTPPTLLLIAGAATLFSATPAVNTGVQYNTPTNLNAGETVAWNVSVAGVGSTCDFSISIVQYGQDPRITLEFAGIPAVLDQGFTLFPTDPATLILEDHIGQAIREEIRGIASSACTMCIEEIMVY